ncbi:MAG: threonine--tRNA ligase [Ruminococcus sp.]|nr:threonine--tRNA ligase [Ruminococcus sp.]MCM1478558.1 threonine--tRNA ligase [Muribaculaceae bacterium]
MIKLTLKDGSVKEIETPMPAAEIVKGIGMGLYKSACCVKIDGEVRDLRAVIDKDCQFEVMTFDSDEGKKTFWHTASHILAQAVKRLYPNVKLAIGPAIDNGFYYDFDAEKAFSAEELANIESEMKKIVKESIEIEQFGLPADEAIAMLEKAGEPYKVELCQEHAGKGEDISFYRQGDFTDLCAGPHLMNTSPVKAFKLTSCTGAYWRGSEKNKMLSRVYGTAYPKASQLEEHLKAAEEAKKRDHNKLGRELEYFTTVDCIGQGLPIILPKGARVIQIMQRWVEDFEQKNGYLLTKTPYMAKRELYKISGHWDHYLDGMFILGDPHDETKECFALRPMTCPFQYQVFLNRARSYRDLPMRLGETSTLFRNEDSGEMHGLIRVRQFTISEGHIILRPEQLEEEFKNCLELAKYALGTVGLLDKCTFRFSQWDPANPKNKYEGTAEQWEEAQAAMKKILDGIGLEYTVGIDEAAFYGPKLDIQYKNVYGKEDTLVTIQIDMLLAAKFGMEYTDVDGKKRMPYIIHRTSLGCYERTLAYLIETYAGALPLWLSPEQVRILPVTDRAMEYSNKVLEKLEKRGIRATVDSRKEGVGYKIRQAQLEKIPYFFIVGDKEAEEGTLSLRSRSDGDLGAMPMDEVIEKICKENEEKAR